jgi:FkbM family methyltransferase
VINVNYAPRLPGLLTHWLAQEPLFLIDVGCSGGISSLWSAFEPNFRALGFDPLVTEIDRLNTTEKRAGVAYEAAFVGYAAYDSLFAPALRQDKVRARNNDPVARSSAIRAAKVMGLDYQKQIFNSGADVVHTDRLVELDAYLSEKQVDLVGFLKIDTDGQDFEVLLGAQESLKRRGILGIEVECQFHGPVHPYANVFSNIDRFLRDAGFSLFELNPWRYTRGAMPGPFLYDIPAQTANGQVRWCDALYFRDAADPEHTAMTGFAPTDGQLAKLACLFELHNLPDCAAELILNHPGTFGTSVDHILDYLTPVKNPGPGAYRKVIEYFESDPTRFYPSRMTPRPRA